MPSNYDKFKNIGDTGELVFKFTNTVAAQHFKEWLCNQGEQMYWDYMTYRECEEEGPITAVNLNYHTDTNVIDVTCGRLDE